MEEKNKKAFAEYSEQLLRQNSKDVEDFVREHVKGMTDEEISAIPFLKKKPKGFDSDAKS